jgi:hypothetical protein
MDHGEEEEHDVDSVEESAQFSPQVGQLSPQVGQLSPQ